MTSFFSKAPLKSFKRGVSGFFLTSSTSASNSFIDMVRSDGHISFGGIKSSGYGRELGQVGMHEFTNAKTVWVG